MLGNLRAEVVTGSVTAGDGGVTHPVALSVGAIKRRIAEANDVLTRLPLPKDYLAMKGGRAAWPAYPLDPSEAFGYADAVVRRSTPSPAELSRLDETLTWIEWIEEPFIRMCALAVGVRAKKGLWEALAQRDNQHRSVRRLQQLVDQGHHTILRRLLSPSTKCVA